MMKSDFFDNHKKYLDGAIKSVEKSARQYSDELRCAIKVAPVVRRAGIKQVDSNVTSVVEKAGRGFRVITELTGNYAKALKSPEFNKEIPARLHIENLPDMFFGNLRK